MTPARATRLWEAGSLLLLAWLIALWLTPSSLVAFPVVLPAVLLLVRHESPDGPN